MIVLREGAAGFYPRETALRFDRPVYWVYERRRRIPKAFGVRTFEGALMSAFREEIIR